MNIAAKTSDIHLTITTKSGEHSIAVKRGTTILDAAHSGGIEIDATCGGRGRCRSCRCKMISGSLPPPSMADTIQLGTEEVHERFRLACQTKLIDDTVICPMPPKSESGHQILAGKGSTTAMAIDSGVVKLPISVAIPTSEHHQSSDLEEIFIALGDLVSTHDVALGIIRDLPATLRKSKGELTATLFRGRLVDVEPGDTSSQAYGIAFDIGTTTIVCSLLDIASGEELASLGMINPQAPFGGDLMSRIAFAQFNKKNLAILRGKVLNALNDLIKQACTEVGILPRHIYKIVVVGNTCMHHILLGIDVSYLGLAPYAPVIRAGLTIPANELPLKSVPNAYVCTLPILAGFAGADALACVLSTGIHNSPEILALADIGTNGELVMGSRERLVVCSAPAGPAFEGAQIRHGMRGAIGAIERVSIGEDVICGIIGDVKAIGICGSGLIEACAQMATAGVLNANGTIRRKNTDELPHQIARRIRREEHGLEFVLVWADESAVGKDITLTQADIRQLQLAKSAIYSGIVMLQQVMDIKSDEVCKLMVCGGFGNFVDVASAVRIRLLPDIPVDRITYFGNAALMGAQMVLLSEAQWQLAEDLAQKIEHVALAACPEFQDLFIEGMNFNSPHPHSAKLATAAAK